MGRCLPPLNVPPSILLSLLCALTLATSIPASTGDVDRRHLLNEVREQLDAGDWPKASKAIQRAEKLILERSKPQRGDERMLAELALYRAVVAANRGETDEAEWFWYLIYHLHPPTAHRDVAGWGEAAAVLAAVELRDLKAEPPGVDTYVGPQSQLEMPAMPTCNTPDSLESSHDMAEVDAFNVEVYVDVEGRPHAPRFLGAPPHPMLLYAWMEQMYEGKWKPARLDGEPVPLVVTIEQNIGRQRW